MDLIEGSLLANAASMGDRLHEGLERVCADASGVRDIRGIGLMIGVEFDTNARAESVQKSAFERGLLVLEAGESTLRFSPPLIVDAAGVDRALELFAEALGT
jgi:4-aminobutyrate aminotransferase